MTDEEICDLMRAKWPLWNYDPFDIAKFRLGWEARGKRDEAVCRERFSDANWHADIKGAADCCAAAIAREGT